MRVTATEVKAVMDNCTVLDTVVDTFIIAAEEIISLVYQGDISISDTLVKEIERYFVAHMLASTVARMASQERIGDVSVSYTGKWEDKLNSTPYGQMVLTLDFTGKMGEIGKRTATLNAISQFHNQQTFIQ